MSATDPTPNTVSAELSQVPVLGPVRRHTCLAFEPDIVGYYLVGRFTRDDLEHLTKLAWDSCGQTRYVCLAFTEALESCDSDLRSVMTDPGELRARSSLESIVVTAKPLERMIIRSMALAARAVGNPGGVVSCASSQARP